MVPSERPSVVGATIPHTAYAEKDEMSPVEYGVSGAVARQFTGDSDLTSSHGNHPGV